MTNNHDCLHEEQIQIQSRKIESLETRADYKEESIKELKADMKELKKSMENVNDSINKFLLKSVNDDGDIMKLINAQDNRITSLESRQDTMYKLLIAFPSILAIIGVIAAYISYIH